MNYDPVDNQIANLVLNINKDYINNHRNIFNKVNSYLRPAFNQKNISEHIVKQSELTNGFNERLSKPSIETNFDIHNKFLKPRPNVVDMSDYNKKFEPEIEKKDMEEYEDEEPDFYNRFGFPEEDEGDKKELKQEIDDTKNYIKKYYGSIQNAPEELQKQLAKFENYLKELEGAGHKKRGCGKVPKNLIIGNRTLAKNSYIGLDNLNNEFAKLNKKGGARTQFPATQGVKKLNKLKVKNMRNSIKFNNLEQEQSDEENEQMQSMTGADLGINRKIGGGRSTYINKLKKIAKDKGISYKEAMIYNSRHK